MKRSVAFLLALALGMALAACGGQGTSSVSVAPSAPSAPSSSSLPQAPATKAAVLSGLEVPLDSFYGFEGVLATADAKARRQKPGA